MRVAIIAAPYPLEEFPSPPLGISYVAAAFEAAGCEVRIFDYIISGYSKEKLAAELARYKPDAVGAGSVTMNFYDAQRILADVKAYNPEILTMMGGPHVSFTVEETLRSCPEIDVIFIGEADDTIIEFAPLIKEQGKWKTVRGIAYRLNGEIINNGRRDFILEVDRIPLPARHLLPISRYQALGYSVSMITGRGCPYSCIFCLGRKMVGSKIRRRQTELVIDEIEQILGLGFERINIADDIFASDSKRVNEICRGIKERKLKFSWSAFARVDTVTQDMFDAMADAGCDSISFGVESGNQEMLKTVRKGITLAEVKKAVNMCKQAGMIAHASFMVGLPGESPQTLKDTSLFAESLNIIYGYHHLAPFPGTTVYEKVNEFDLAILTKDWSKYDANDAIVKTSFIEPQDLRNFVALYNETMDAHWQEVVKGYKTPRNTPLDDLRVEGNWRMHLTFKMLKNDLIEKNGFIDHLLCEKSKDKARDELCRRIAEKTKAAPQIVQHTIKDFIKRGYLKIEDTDGGFVWSWST